MAEIRIERLEQATTLAAQPALIALLQDAVHHGAAVGFVPPVSEAQGQAYWELVASEVEQGSRVLLVARDGADTIVGTVQLVLAGQVNGQHRAEVSRLLVHTSARGRGIARQLLAALETSARQLGRTTLVLDTRQGDHAEAIYRRLGWQEVGVIPNYAANGDGSYHATVFFYKLLG